MTALVLGLCCWAVLRPAAPDTRPALASEAGGTAGSAAQARALELLHEWDERRAGAWAAGDVAALRSLYVTGSRTAAEDVAMLRRYVSRGLVVEDLRTQVLSLSVLGDRSPRSVRLEVTDRVSGGSVVTRDGASRDLPRDQASTRVVTLRRVGEDWLVAEVRDRAG